MNLLPNLSDISFKFGNKFIYANKLILKVQCNHFFNMFSGEWNETEAQVIDITQFSYDVFYAFIKYLYFECVQISFQNAIYLYDLANSYLENECKTKCSQIIKN